MSQQPQAIFRKDYRSPDFLVESIELRIDLYDDETFVDSTLRLRRNPDSADGNAPLRLHGEELTLLELRIDGTALAEHAYAVNGESLNIEGVPDQFTLAARVRIHPEKNTALSGLYRSGGMFCSQCEAEGFRRITYMLDRPDVLARYRTTLIADKGRFPVLLANGNRVDIKELVDGRHAVTWEDPYPKPTYLFACVAGNLSCLTDRFTTADGREVALELYVEHQNKDKTEHAMASLKRAMAWDEQKYGLAYDLDIYMIVAVGDFNMGAMENKGLNIFNTQYVLASPATATDTDFENIEAVIGHEYFHNWTGNRVTCRDWFQLSLKEGLTVFREQQFSADMGSAAVKRIDDVRILRAHQFPEDAGPTAHPIRPDEYVEINNFYTATVYNKGAEVIRMLHTLLGADGFRHGMDLYFERHDGQAVTCDDFVNAMADANDRDLTLFKRWYEQAGTPEVQLSSQRSSDGALTLTLTQKTPATPGQPVKQPMHMPISIGLVGANGESIPFQVDGVASDAQGSVVLELTGHRQSFTIADAPEGAVVSALRGFSAPVRLKQALSNADLKTLMAFDTDPFNRWEASQRLAGRILHGELDGKPDPEAYAVYLQAVSELLSQDADPAFVAEAVSLPGETLLADERDKVDPVAIHQVREALLDRLAAACQPLWKKLWDKHHKADSADARRIANAALAALARHQADTWVETCIDRAANTKNMTNALAALSILAKTAGDASDQALQDFYERWRDEPLVVDKWFRVQAGTTRPDCLRRVKALLAHPAFDRRNPNRARALLGAFAQGNPACFHAADGEGYRFLAEQVGLQDDINPQVAARLVVPLSRWARYSPDRQLMMQEALKGILQRPGLSNDVFEIVSRSLADM